MHGVSLFPTRPIETAADIGVGMIYVEGKGSLKLEAVGQGIERYKQHKRHENDQPERLTVCAHDRHCLATHHEGKHVMNERY